MDSGHILVSEVSVNVSETLKCCDKASFSENTHLVQTHEPAQFPQSMTLQSSLVTIQETSRLRSRRPVRLMWRVAANYTQILRMDLRRYAVRSSGAHPR